MLEVFAVCKCMRDGERAWVRRGRAAAAEVDKHAENNELSTRAGGVSRVAKRVRGWSRRGKDSEQTVMFLGSEKKTHVHAARQATFMMMGTVVVIDSYRGGAGDAPLDEDKARAGRGHFSEEAAPLSLSHLAARRKRQRTAPAGYV